MRWQTEANRRYYQEMVKGLAQPKVLLVYFAREDDEIPGLIERDKNNFAWANPGVEIEYLVATEGDFAKQVQESDVILLADGETDKLIATVKRTGIDLKQAFEGKIVSGSSAEAYLIAEWYYTNNDREIRRGLGLLPIAVWAHYRPEKGSEYDISESEIETIEKEMLTHVSEDKFIKIPEQEMVVLQ